MEKSCDTCLFYVDAMPDLIICIAGKRTKEYIYMKNDCKKWVENTAANAKEQLEKLKQEKGL